MNTEKQLLTVREQEFFAFLKKYRGKRPKNAQIARDFGIDRRRVHQLMERLRLKNWIPELNGSKGRGK